MADTIKIAGKTYPKPRVERFKRKDARALTALMKRVQDDEMDLDALWDMVDVAVPTLPEDVLDDLTVEECQQVMIDAGIFAETDKVSEDVSVGE